MKKLFFGIIIFILAVSAFGETYIVNAYGTGDYATIQDAVNAARAGDVIVLQPGTYSGEGNCNIDYRGKDITIRSVNPDDPACVEETIIDCNDSGFERNRALIFQSGETEYSVITGITIQNGYVGTGHAGGGIFCTNASSPTIKSCVFRNCIVFLGLGGGAIACVEQSSPYITNCIFSHNESRGASGGAILSDNSNLTVENCIFRNNISFGGGGAIYASEGNFNIYSSELSGNKAGEPEAGEFKGGQAMANGGAISSFECNLIIERCDIINNTIAENFVGRGGALSTDGCIAKIVDSNISSNQAYDGGGIYCTNKTQINIEGCQINKNRASLSEKAWGRNEGGGMFCEKTKLKMRDCVISHNQAHGSNSKTTGYGGGVFMYSGSGTFTNCLFTRNLAWADNFDTENGCGGGLYAPQTTIDINNCTFVYNMAEPEGQGSGFYSNGSPSVTNSIFWANQGVESDSQIYDSSVKVTNSDIQGGWPGKGNINADPCFVSGQKGKYYLSQTSAGQAFQSPCVDTGSDTAENLGMDLLTTSTRGIYDAEIVDMGYHYVDANVPGLDVSPEQLIIELKQDREKPEPQMITITNSGNGALHWTATTDVNWLILDLDFGTCKDYEDFSIINVDADMAGLDEGRYFGNITISDPHARNSPKQIMVELKAVGALIGLSQHQFYIDANRVDDEPVVEKFSIFNTGGSVLNWNLSDPCDWLRAEPESGSTTNEIDDVNIIIDTSELATGTHTCMLTVTAEDVNNSPQTVEVYLNVVGSMIQLSQDYFSFETQKDDEGFAKRPLSRLGAPENPPSQKLTIKNAGGGILNWKIKEQCHWLSVHPKSGSIANDINDVNVAVDISGLESGIYTCKFEVYSNDDTIDRQTVTIQLVVINYNAMDLDKNLTVDFSDFAILTSRLSRKTEAPAATERGQASPDETSIADVNGSNDSIDFELLALFCRSWLETEYLELKIPSLVSHWKLDGDVKDSASSNHGVKYGGKWTEGKIKQGLDFEKVDDRVVIEDHDSLTPGEEFTIAFWIYNRDNGGGGIYKAVDCDNFPMMTDEPGSYSLQIKPDSSLVEFTVFESGIFHDSIFSLNPISTNGWHHIAATFNRSEAKIYIDGVQNGSLKMRATSVKNDFLPLRFGCRWEQCDKDKYSVNAKSILDDIRIYSKALTGDEVKTLYSWGKIAD